VSIAVGVPPIRRFRTDAISCEQPLLGKVLLQNRFPYAVGFMSIWFRSGGLCRRASLLALVFASCFAHSESSLASGSNATFYTNSLTNTLPPLTENFVVGGGGYGSFEVNDGVGLELLSQAPNWYEAVRGFRIPLSAGVSWQITVRAHVSSSLGATQTNPSYVASLVLTKLTRNPDGFASVLSTAPNRHVLSLSRSDGLMNDLVVQNVVTSYRKSQGADMEDTRFPIGGQEDIYLRLEYDADEKLLVPSASYDGVNFTPFPSASLGADEEWQMEDTDTLAVALSVSSMPYVHVDTPPRDFYSTYDSFGMGADDPSQLPEITESVGHGDVHLKDLSITYTPTVLNSDTFNVGVSASRGMMIDVYAPGLRHLALPEDAATSGEDRIWYVNANNSTLLSLVLPASIKQISGEFVSAAPDLLTINIPPTIEVIEPGAFSGPNKLLNAVLPDRFVFQGNLLGFDGTIAYRMFVQQIADSLANNELFMAALATNEKFIGLLAFKVLSRFQAYGLVTRSDLSDLATKQELQDAIDQSRTAGINSVLANPNSWSLYTADQVSGLSIGDLTLTRQENGSFVLNYDIEQSNDMKTWTTYQNYGEELTGLPTNKQFIRIRVKQ
jgi:hypothetical protein